MAGQWQEFNGTTYNNPVSDINLGIWPWDEGNQTWTPVVAFIDSDASLPVVRYFNWTTSDWATLEPMPTQGTISGLKVRFTIMGFIPLVAFSDDALGGKGSLVFPNLYARRRLLSASGAASFASAQGMGIDYGLKWSYLPPAQPNFTAGAASDFDMTVAGTTAAVVAYRDGTQGGALSSQVYTGPNGLVNFGQQGFTPGAAGGTAVAASFMLGSTSDWVYCAFRDETSKPHRMSVYKINAVDWFAWYDQTH